MVQSEGNSLVNNSFNSTTSSPSPSARRLLSHTLIHSVLILAAIITLIPFAWLLASSIKTSADFFTSVFLPTGTGWGGIAWDRLTLGHYERLFLELGIARNLLNSFFISSVTALGATLAASMGGYALAKFRFTGSSIVTSIVLAALIIPAPLLLAPGYLFIYQLGLLDSYTGLLLPAMAPAFGVYLFRQAIWNSVPDEILESARIDGAGEFRIFFTLVVPLMRPMIGAFLLITFLGMWNNFIGPQVIFQSPELFPLSVSINQLKGVYSQDYGLIMAGTVISIAPVLCLFLLLQREFISGLTAGAVKG